MFACSRSQQATKPLSFASLATEALGAMRLHHLSALGKGTGVSQRGGVEQSLWMLSRRPGALLASGSAHLIPKAALRRRWHSGRLQSLAADASEVLLVGSGSVVGERESHHGRSGRGPCSMLSPCSLNATIHQFNAGRSNASISRSRSFPRL